MVIGALRLELHFPACGSLKEKRQILKSIMGRIRSRYNISVAEVDHNDLWQRAAIGISAVSQTEYQTRKILTKIVQEVENRGKAVVVSSQISVFAPE